MDCFGSGKRDQEGAKPSGTAGVHSAPPGRRSSSPANHPCLGRNHRIPNSSDAACGSYCALPPPNGSPFAHKMTAAQSLLRPASTLIPEQGHIFPIKCPFDTRAFPNQPAVGFFFPPYGPLSPRTREKRRHCRLHT